MTNSKWFYNQQSNAKLYLHNNYDEVVSCNSQNIQKDFVYETYTVVKDLKLINILVMLNKRNQFAVYEMAALINCPTLNTKQYQ